jgi:hypothetical protein
MSRAGVGAAIAERCLGHIPWSQNDSRTPSETLAPDLLQPWNGVLICDPSRAANGRRRHRRGFGRALRWPRPERIEVSILSRSMLKVLASNWIENNLIDVLVQTGSRPRAEMPDLPLLVDLVSDPRRQEGHRVVIVCVSSSAARF